MDATNQRYVKLGLIGHPVSHSISPLLHGAALSYANIRGEYNLIDVATEDELAGRVSELVTEGYEGWNVTVPHKQAMFRLVDEVTNEASKTGAVNTVKVSGTAAGAKLIGHNTDLGGFKGDLQSFLPESGGLHGMILGAGGAARAAFWALVELEAEIIWVVARNGNQALALAQCAPNGRALQIDQAAATDSSLVINCTPIGLKVQDVPSWVESLLTASSNRQRYFYDMVYSRTAGDTTLLTRQASAHGWICRDGLGMLLNQAALAFEFWTGIQVPADQLLQRTQSL